MKRWLVLALGLGIAAVAGWAVLTGVDAGGGASVSPPKPPVEGAHSEIDQASRDQLRSILREADREASDSL